MKADKKIVLALVKNNENSIRHATIMMNLIFIDNLIVIL